jgi:hypothetical protein
VLRNACLALITALGLSVIQSPAAHAEGSTAVGGINGVIYEGCQDLQFTYQVDPNQAGYDWAIFVKAWDPRGIEASSGSVWKDEGYPASGTSSGDDGLFFCSDALPGTYILTAEIHFYGGPHNDAVLPQSSFQLRKAKSRTKLKVNDKSAAIGQTLRFTAVSKVEFPNGYFANDYEYVVLQRRTGSGWSKFGRAYTNSKGMATFEKRWSEKGPVIVRAVTPPAGNYRKSKSVTIRID